MNIPELRKAIDSDSLSKFIILYGPEGAVLDIYIDKIRKLFGKSVYSADSVLSIYGRLSGHSLISSGKELYVVREDKDILTNESLWEGLMEHLEDGDTYIVLKYDSLDGRSKFLKHFQDNAVFFDKLSDALLAKYISKDVELTKIQTQKLITMCQYEYRRILIELDKIKNLSAYYKISHKDAFDLCMHNHAFCSAPEGQIFDIADSILSRDMNAIRAQMQNSILRGDNPLAVLSILHTSVKAVLQVQLCQSMKNTAEVTGLTAYQIKNAMRFKDNFSINELIKFIKYINYCDKAVKNGEIPAEKVIDFLLVNVL